MNENWKAYIKENDEIYVSITSERLHFLCEMVSDVIFRGKTCKAKVLDEIMQRTCSVLTGLSCMIYGTFS